GGGGGGGGGDVGRLRLSGTCGDQLDMRIQNVGDPLKIGITIPSADPTEQWTITATEQGYGVVTGGRVGNPVDLIGSGLLPPPTFNSTEGGFSTEGFVPNTSGVTHGFSYVATRTSPTPLTCTNTGYWTTPSGSEGPTAQNPSGKPDTAPALTGATEADAGANDVALQFDQEMLATAQGMPDLSRFSVTVDGVARNVTGATVNDDSPPLDAILDITFDGAPLTAGQTVAVVYRQPLTTGTPALQDLDSLQTASFGPVSVPVF
ncbi:MAG TPA: SwmB domain-containing protein, partial [Pseudonocardiaceae bacterium]|nr:SwmB domain-containing protein [Pseudonocardiaceae bacterium]